MKYVILIIALISFSATELFSQAKKPTLMVVPSDALLSQLGVSNSDNPMKQAFVKYPELLLAISKINGLMASRGFPLKNLESVMKSIEDRQAEEMMLASSETGSSTSESMYDLLRKTAKADIILQLTYSVNKTGPRSSITYNLQGLDAYTNKQIATAAGTGEKSMSAEIPLLLEEAVLGHMDPFAASLMEHFDDLFENGREIVVHIKKWAGWEFDLESTFGDKEDELSFIIEDWFAENTVQGRFSTSEITENMMFLEQVRIPMYYERNGRQYAMDTRRFVRNLGSYLKEEPYSIPSKIVTRGLGEAWLILGGK